MHGPGFKLPGLAAHVGGDELGQVLEVSTHTSPLTFVANVKTST